MMLRILILLSVSLGLFTFSFAQVNYGVKGGITQSFVKAMPQAANAKNTLQTGFQVGVFLDKAITNNIILRPSLHLTQKGYQSVEGNPGGPFYWSRNLSTTYLELPLEALRKFPINQTSSFYIGSGPIVSYGLRGKLKAAVVATDNTQQLHTQISTDDKIFKTNIDHRFDFGWDFAVGFQNCRMMVNASYNHGISNVVKGGNQSLKNRSFAFTVGYLLW